MFGLSLNGMEWQAIKTRLEWFGFCFFKKKNYIINIYDKNPRNKFMNKM
jgi:hypothetical protein